MSCELDLGVQEVVERIWKELRLMRLYTKRYVIRYDLIQSVCLVESILFGLILTVTCRKGEVPDFSEALIVRRDSSIEDVCDQVHRTLKDTFKYAMVWGASARHVPQRVGLSHMVADEDVVSIVAK